MMENRLIPWLTISDWREANQTLRVIIDRYRAALDDAIALAVEIRLRSVAMFPLIDRMGKRFCTKCGHPCCRIASVWYDYADLVFIHLNQLTVPPMQILKKPGVGCSYLSRNGCMLPRPIRPWICTWYLCPDQMEYLRTHVPTESLRILQQLSRIKKKRRQMEDIFIQSVTAE